MILEVVIVREYNMGYKHGLEWAIWLLGQEMTVDQVLRLLRAKVSGFSESARAHDRGLAEDRARMRADFKKEMMMGSPDP